MRRGLTSPPALSGRAAHVSTRLPPARWNLRPRLVPRMALPLRMDIPPHESISYSQLQKQEAPALLPEPPATGSLLDVMPYIGELALGEKSLNWRVAAALTLLFISKGAGITCPMMLKRAVDEISVGSVSGSMEGVVMAIVAYGLCDIIKHVAKELQMPVFTPVSQAAARRVAYHTFAHVLDLDIQFHLNKRTGRLSRVLERGKSSIQYLYRAIFFTFIPTFVELVVVCSVLAGSFSPWVAGTVALTFSAYTAWTLGLTQLTTEARKKVVNLENQTSSKTVDALLNYETVALFNNQRLEVGQYDWNLRALQKAFINIERLSATMNAGQSTILAMGLAGVMVTAVKTSTRVGGISPGDLIMIQGMLLQLWAPLQFLGWFYRELRASLVDIADFFDILRTQSSIKDGPISAIPGIPQDVADQNSSHLSQPEQSIANHKVENGSIHETMHHRADNVSSNSSSSRSSNADEASTSALSAYRKGGLRAELQDIKFGYNTERQILKGVSMTIEPGTSIALVGSSGSGKSTMLRMLTRMFDASSGKVLLNGVDVKDLSKEALREAIAVVPQETVLFNDTIMENIRYGRPSATDDDVMVAAGMAKLHDAVLRMTDGYATTVGERGLKLSGGEKQRVAIARAFLRSPRLLICDEATSALDSETEVQIMSSLTELAEGRTSVFVAHRLSTIKNCDIIFVLSAGRVVESGSHAALLETPGGMYRGMWELQLTEEATGPYAAVGSNLLTSDDSDSDSN